MMRENLENTGGRDLVGRFDRGYRREGGTRRGEKYDRNLGFQAGLVARDVLFCLRQSIFV